MCIYPRAAAAATGCTPANEQTIKQKDFSSVSADFLRSCLAFIISTLASLSPRQRNSWCSAKHSHL